METREVLADFCGRVQQAYHHIVDGLPGEVLAARPDEGANPIGWLLWHTARVQDEHIASIAGWEQTYLADGWAERLGLSPDGDDIGYGHTAAQVAAIPAERGEGLLAYLDAVSAQTQRYLAGVDAGELDRIIDRSYDPPVSVGVRLVSMFGDHLMHAGQADYVKGLLERAGGPA